LNINRNTSHPSAFISSTFLDLKEERKAVADILMQERIGVNALDIRPASNDSSRNEIINGIQESDFIILIIGQRYGTISQDMTNSPINSITKWEYLQAKVRFRKHILVFIKDLNSFNRVACEPESNKYLELQKKFIIEASRHNPKYFSSISELEEEIKKALIPIYRAGVLSLLSTVEKKEDENKFLKQEIEKLKLGSQTSTSENLATQKVDLGKNGIFSGLGAGGMLAGNYGGETGLGAVSNFGANFTGNNKAGFGGLSDAASSLPKGMLSQGLDGKT
jgi:hypothetical protein